MIRHPEVRVRLTGNALEVVHAVTKAMRRAGVRSDELEAFRREALGGSYADLIGTCREWVDVR